MEKEFSPNDCQKIMDQMTSSHNDACITMYQHVNYKHILIVEVLSVGSSDIKALAAMNISTTMFASGHKVEVWMQKY